jgi:hypothetical protein
MDISRVATPNSWRPVNHLGVKPRGTRPTQPVDDRSLYIDRRFVGCKAVLEVPGGSWFFVRVLVGRPNVLEKFFDDLPED